MKKGLRQGKKLKGVRGCPINCGVSEQTIIYEYNGRILYPKKW